MQAITTIGLDIAKPVFQVHGVDAQGLRNLTNETALSVNRAACRSHDTEKSSAERGCQSYQTPPEECGRVYHSTAR
jgi:hypothetical protein